MWGGWTPRRPARTSSGGWRRTTRRPSRISPAAGPGSSGSWSGSLPLPRGKTGDPGPRPRGRDGKGQVDRGPPRSRAPRPDDDRAVQLVRPREVRGGPPPRPRPRGPRRPGVRREPRDLRLPLREGTADPARGRPLGLRHDIDRGGREVSGRARGGGSFPDVRLPEKGVPAPARGDRCDDEPAGPAAAGERDAPRGPPEARDVDLPRIRPRAAGPRRPRCVPARTVPLRPYGPRPLPRDRDRARRGARPHLGRPPSRLREPGRNLHPPPAGIRVPWPPPPPRKPPPPPVRPPRPRRARCAGRRWRRASSPRRASSAGRSG